MLGHFLSHYHHLGVWPNHTKIAIRVRRSASHEQLQATLTTLQAHGILHSNVEMLRMAPSDATKIVLINRHLQSIPREAFSIYADVDELFDYPCELQGAVTRGKYCFAGYMVDQLAANGNITEMKPEPDLALQYPLQCRIREAVIPKLQSTKIILHRPNPDCAPQAREGRCNHTTFIGFRTTHAVATMVRNTQQLALNGTPARCGVRGIVRHYTMTSRQLQGNLEKASLKLAGRQPSETRNYANATCAVTDPLTGACRDYGLLHDFMEKLAREASMQRNGNIAASLGVALPARCTHSLAKMQDGATCSDSRPEMC